MNRLVVAAVLVATFESIALAQPGAAEPVPPPPQPVAPSEPLSENTALLLSLGGTVVSWGLVVGGGTVGSGEAETVGLVGTLIAPSFGHWYADKYLTRGLGLRAAGIGVVFVGALVALSQCPLTFGHDDQEPCEENALPYVLLAAGAGVFVWGTIDDIATAPRRVRERNARPELALVPSLRSDGAGVTLAGRF